MKTFKVCVVLNITKGLGNVVLNKVNDANVPKMINDNLTGCGTYQRREILWVDYGLSWDLYLYYYININSYCLIKKNSNKYIAKALKFIFMHNYVVKNELISSVKKGFEDNMKNKGCIVIIASITCSYTSCI